MSLIHVAGKRFLKLSVRGAPNGCQTAAASSQAPTFSRQFSLCILRQPCLPATRVPKGSRHLTTKAQPNAKFIRPNKSKKGASGFGLRTIMIGFGALSVAGTTFAVTMPDEASKIWTAIGGEHALEQLNDYMEDDEKDSSLPDWPIHFGPQPRYVLVVGLEETLVHSTWSRKYGWRHAKRPGVDEFLKGTCRDYEIVIYSNGSINFTNDIISQIADAKGIFVWRLGGDDMQTVKGKGIKAKDLAGLNRPMDRIFTLDSNPDAYHLNPENAIPIAPFQDPANLEDSALMDLLPFFQDMAFLDTDVRKVIASYPDASKIGETYLQQKIDVEKAQIAKKPKGLGGWLKGFK